MNSNEFLDPNNLCENSHPGQWHALAMLGLPNNRQEGKVIAAGRSASSSSSESEAGRSVALVGSTPKCLEVAPKSYKIPWNATERGRLESRSHGIADFTKIYQLLARSKTLLKRWIRWGVCIYKAKTLNYPKP